MRSKIRLLQEKYLSGESTVMDEVQNRLDRAKKNTKNSCLHVLEQDAVSKAQEIDDQIAQLERKTEQSHQGRLFGVPFGVKDCFMVKDTPTTAGSHMLEKYVAPYHATVIQRLLNEGAVLITKENMDQFGHGSTGENSYFGPTRNANDNEKVAGGSSSGSAVNVAQDITAFSIGEDTGGSVRQPAGYNKVFGFKPSYGKVSRNGVVSYASSLDTVSPVASSIEDIALIMNVIGGDDEDAHDMTNSSYEQLDLETLDKLDLSKKTFGYYDTFLSHESLDKDIKYSIENLLKRLQDAGANIEKLDFFPGKLLVATYYVIAMAETASELARLDGVKYGLRSSKIKQRKDIYLKSRSEGFSEETKRRVILGNQILSEGFDDKYYHKALVAREQLRKHFAKDFQKVDFIVSPVTPNKIPDLGENLDDPVAMYMTDLYTVGFSLGGLPTLSLPIDSPTGIQVTGGFDEDHDVLRAGYQLQNIYET